MTGGFGSLEDFGALVIWMFKGFNGLLENAKRDIQQYMLELRLSYYLFLLYLVFNSNCS